MTKLARLAVLALLAVCASTPQAGPVIGRGTWETTLKARDIDGNSVALNNVSAAFFYDTTLDVTWLANMNQSGLMSWSSATAWADGLATGGFTDWRLPTIVDSGSTGCDFRFSGGTDCGFNVQTQVGDAYSEWAHLIYVTLGNLAGCAPGSGTFDFCNGQVGWGLVNTAYFQNMQSDAYWSGTEYALDPRFAWFMHTDTGLQQFNMKWDTLYAVAVRSGDVLRDGGTVSEPQSMALTLTALCCIGLALRQRSAN